MGQDKSRLRLGRYTLAGYIRKHLASDDLQVMEIRRDAYPACGPLSGIATALKSGRASRYVFLACDMPFVPREWIDRLLRKKTPAFTEINEAVGFPFLLDESHLGVVEALMREKKFSVQGLAKTLGALRLSPPRRLLPAFANINTPEDWAKYRIIGGEL
jgi:molybdopterin-guanine dinucleotide biosynthesis protein A